MQTLIFARESVMGRKSVVALCAMITATTLAFASPFASAEETDKEKVDIFGSVSVSGNYLDVEGDNAKFQEYRDVPDRGAELDHIRLQVIQERKYFTLEGQELSQDDQSLRLEGGLYGKVKLEASWDEIPHNYSENARVLGTLKGGNYWAVPDLVQTELQGEFPLGRETAAPFLTNTPTAAGVATLNDLLGHANTMSLNIQREKGELGIVYTPLVNLNLRAGYSHEDREGFRALSAGAYERDTGARDGAESSGAWLQGGVGENFMLYGLEFPEPIDYDTDVVSLGIDYRGGIWHMDAAYQYTSFKNRVDYVTWDNPLRATGWSVVADPGPPVTMEERVGSPATNRLDLFPDSESHNFSLTGGVELPLNSKLTGTLSWGKVTQDDDFLAYTVNPQLWINQELDNPAISKDLPANDLGGEAITTLANVVLTSRPIDPLNVTLKINYYDYANETDKISWIDGWARIGESRWSKAGEAGVINRVPAWSRLRVPLYASYSITDGLMLSADYEYEYIDRNEDRNADNEEHTLGAGIVYNPTDTANMRLSYHRSQREIDGDYQISIGEGRGTVDPNANPFHEWEELRRFDQADRDRDSVKAMAGYNPMDTLSLGFSLDYTNDQYDTTYYGMQESEGYQLGLDANYAVTDRVLLFGYYAREDYSSAMLNRAKTSAGGGGNFDYLENDYATDMDDVTDTIGAGITWDMIVDKLTCSLSADYAKYVGQIDTSNPHFNDAAGDPARTTSSALAFDWPDLETDTTQVKLDLDYAFTENLSFGLHYLYEKFDVTDFATDNVSSYGNPNDTQGSSLDYFIFMDANFSDYDAHRVGLSMTYSF